MCLHDHTSAPALPANLPRRGILAGAAALAGISVATIAAQIGGAPAAHAAERPSGPNYHGSPLAHPALIIEGGTIVDPKTGDAVEDGVLVLDGGKVAAVGTRDATRKAVAAVAGRAQRPERHRPLGAPRPDRRARPRQRVRRCPRHPAGRRHQRPQRLDAASTRTWPCGRSRAGPRASPAHGAAGLFISPELGDFAAGRPRPRAAGHPRRRRQGSRRPGVPDPGQPQARSRGHQDPRQPARRAAGAGPARTGLQPGAARRRGQGSERRRRAVPRLQRGGDRRRRPGRGAQHRARRLRHRGHHRARWPAGEPTSRPPWTRSPAWRRPPTRSSPRAGREYTPDPAGRRPRRPAKQA